MKFRLPLLGSFLLFLGIFPGISAQKAPDDRIGSTLPSFAFPSADGKIVTHYDLPLGKPVVIFYFDPECEHCQQQGEWINERKTDLAEVTFVFVAYADSGAIKNYRDKFISGGGPNMFFLMDPKFQFDKVFGYSESPTLHIFNSKWTKVQVFRNNIAVEEILNVLK